QHGATGVLLARSGFLTRLSEPPLQFLNKPPAVRLRFEEIGQDEGIEFLRHQLAARQRRNEARGIPPAAWRSGVALGGLLTAAVGGYLWLHFNGISSLEGEPPARSASGTSLTRG